jgi:shikimate dehydrogenase
MSETLRSACVIGWPAGHSRSPLIHNYWINEHNIAGEYRQEAVPPEQFPEFLESLAKRGYVGANVTLPHKVAALALTKPDDRAKAVGAVNTIWRVGRTLRSTNTDVEGFLENLDASVSGWAKGLEKAVVLGAGGAARACVFGLIERSVPHIHVVNRTPERAGTIAERFGATVRAGKWEELTGLLTGTALLVNATTLGMAGHPPLDINLKPLPDSAVVVDLVYVPLATPLLKAARERGLRAADGLGMLLHQAVRGFQLWFGVRPDVTERLRALVEADLAKDTGRQAAAADGM